MRVLITGASGLLGLNACLMQATKHEIVGVTYHTALRGTQFKVLQSNLALDGALADLIEQVAPDVFLNCAAMAQVDQCESDPDQAARINAWMPGVAGHQTRHFAVESAKTGD